MLYVLNFKKGLAKPLDSKFSNDEKQDIWRWRNTLLKQVKSYIDNNLNPTKVIYLFSYTFFIVNKQKKLNKTGICRSIKPSKDD